MAIPSNLDTFDRSNAVAAILEAIPPHTAAPTSVAELSVSEVAPGEVSIIFRSLVPILQVFDALEVIHAANLQGPLVRAKSESAYYFLRSFAAFIREEMTLTSNWERLGTVLGDQISLDALLAGPQFLRMMERVRASFDGKPIRQLVISKAIITARFGIFGKLRFLVRYESSINMYQLVGGRKRNADANMEVTLRREIDEELGTLEERPAIVKIFPLGNHINYIGISPGIGALTDHKLHYYVVTVRDLNPSAPGLLWVSTKELLACSARRRGRINEPAITKLDQSLNGGLASLAPSFANPASYQIIRQGFSNIIRERTWELVGLIIGVIGILVSLKFG